MLKKKTLKKAQTNKWSLKPKLWKPVADDGLLLDLQFTCQFSEKEVILTFAFFPLI